MTTNPSTTAIAPRTWRHHLRLVATLAAKDIVDALKDKTTLTTIVISLLMVMFYRYLPLLTADPDTLNVLLYAETESPITAALESSPALAVYTYASREQLMAVFASAEDVELAVVTPPTVPASGPITLDGYLMYWLNAAQRADIQSRIETELTTQLGRPVTLNLIGHDVYFDADTFFFAFSSTIALLFITSMIAISIVPNLMIEERRTGTLNMLMVSPASAGHLVAGKAIAGLFYGMVGSAVVLVSFGYLIVQWPLALLAAALMTLFMAALGLLLGLLVKVRAQLQLVAWFVLLPLMVPVILVALEGIVPAGVLSVVQWIPTVLVAKIFRLSLTPNATLAHFGMETAVTIAITLLMLLAVVWLVQQWDRR